MSKMNVPEEDRQALALNALEAHLERAFCKIVNPRRRRPLHPQTVQDLLVAKAERRRPVHPQYGWKLVFLDFQSFRTEIDVIKVPDEHGGRRHATRADVVEIRDAMMRDFGYDMCWFRMRTTEDVRKVG